MRSHNEYKILVTGRIAVQSGEITMDALVNTLVLFGILALMLFGPKRRGHQAGPIARVGSVALFTLLALAFALAYLWSLVVGDRLPLSVG
jgi:hypothetical protein